MSPGFCLVERGDGGRRTARWLLSLQRLARNACLANAGDLRLGEGSLELLDLDLSEVDDGPLIFDLQSEMAFAKEIEFVHRLKG